MDLYVLERAFASTHPDSEALFASILAAYANRVGKEWDQIKKRLDEGKTGHGAPNFKVLKCRFQSVSVAESGVWLAEVGHWGQKCHGILHHLSSRCECAYWRQVIP